MSEILILSGVILLTMLRYTSNVLAENQQEEIQHLLNIYATTLEYSLHTTDNNLLSIAQEQKSLEHLSAKEEASRYYATADLIDIIMIQLICWWQSGITRTMHPMPVLALQ